MTMALPLLSPRVSAQGCTSCDLALNRTHVVDGVGPNNVALMCIGEAPGADEDKQGVPFVGQSGKLLRATLAAAGFPDGTYYLTNTVRCRPPGNRDPEPAEQAACAVHLAAEIATVRPDVILALGKQAARVLATDPILTGTLASLQDAGLCQIVEAYHPAYILRSSRFRYAWEKQIQDAADTALRRARVVTPSLTLPPPFTYWCADTETDDLEEGIGVRAVAWTLSDGHSRRFETGDTAYGGVWHLPRVFMHNAKYDAPLLGIDLRDLSRWECSMLMAYVLRFPEIGLKKLAPSLAGLTLHEIADIIGRGKKRVPFSRALAERPTEARAYASDDAVAGARVGYACDLRLTGRQRWYYNNVEKPMVPVLCDMETVGVQVNPAKLRELEGQLDESIRLQNLALRHDYGLNPGWAQSKKGDLEGLLTKLGVTLTKKTPTGQWQLDAALLDSLSPPEVQEELDEPGAGTTRIGGTATDLDMAVWRVKRIRKQEKLKSTYVLPLQAKRDRTGRVHAHFNQGVTTTNRLSSSDPNLQNIPIRGAIQKTMRQVFEAAPGYTIVKADYRQLEVCVYADKTREPVLLDAYLHTDHDTSGPDRSCTRCDVHQRVADMLHIPRWRAKNTLFATLYGAAAAKLALTAGVSATDTAPFLALMRRDMPSLLQWQPSIAAELTSQGYLENPVGWRNYWPLFFSPIRKESAAALREAANFPIQSTGASIVKLLMIALDLVARAIGARLVLTVHDEVVYECPTEYVPWFKHQLAQAGRDVARPYLKLVPLTLDISSGRDWGSCA